MTAEKINQILELRLKSATIKDIAEELNVSETTITDYLKVAYDQCDKMIRDDLDEIAYRIKSKYKDERLEETLELRLQNKSVNEIADIMRCEPSTVQWRLKEILKKNNEEINIRLRKIAEKQRYKKKDRLSFHDLTNYELGIFWGVGSFIEEENTVVFRERRKHFIEVMERLVESNLYQHTLEKRKTQYILKSSMFDIGSFIDNGWSKRNASTRDVPPLDDYRDFLRAYIELHSGINYSLRYSGNKKIKKKLLVFQIFGNYKLIDSINEILNSQIGVTLKTPQRTSNKTTKVLNYASFREIEKIFNWLRDDQEFCKDYWDEFYYKLNNPVKEIYQS